jgi:hypothetical protein
MLETSLLEICWNGCEKHVSSSECIPNTVIIFERDKTASGRSEMSLAATRPCRLQLCTLPRTLGAR